MKTFLPALSFSRLSVWFASCFLAAPALVSYGIDTNGIADFRSADGSGNNVAHPDLGETDTPLTRVAPADYGDGTDLPRGVPVEDEGDGDVEVDEQTLPSGRTISNTINDQNGQDLPSGRNLSQLFFQFGQFLSHDTGLSEPNSGIATGGMTGLSGNESFNIEVEPGDPDFLSPIVPLSRSIAEAASASPTGKREQINQITAFIDASNVYGSTQSRADALRTFVGGKLRSQAGPGGDLLPYNTGGTQENANPTMLDPNIMFLAGDVRANEQIGLIAFHTLFMREHNRLCDEIAAADFSGASLANAAVDEEIYQRARATVAAMIQKIVYYDWLPVLLGYDAMPYYTGYDPSVNPQIANEFSTAAFRIGHTLLPSTYLLTDSNGTVTPFALQDAFFNPGYIAANGIDDILRGESTNIQQELDPYIVDDVRVFLFGPGFGLDLAALNIQRGRDHGVPSYSQIRSSYGLPGLTQYGDIPAKAGVVSDLESLYGGAGYGDIDAWVGGLCEKHLPGTNLGETFTEVFVDQFTRLRDGDRFYFENRNVYPASFIDDILNTNLIQIIKRNTSLDWDEMNDYSFFLPRYHPFQPDVRVGKVYNVGAHRGDDKYNDNGVGQRVRSKRSRGRAKFFSSIENDGAYMNPIRVRTGLIGPRDYRLRIFDVSNGRRNVTGALYTGRYVRIPSPQGIKKLKGVAISRGLSYPRNYRRVVCFHAESDSDTQAKDVGMVQIKF